MPRPAALTLCSALRVNANSRIAFTGAGGKTTAIFNLAREAAGIYPAVLVTSSTHLATHQAAAGDQHVVIQSEADVALLDPGKIRGVLVVTGDAGSDERVTGLTLDFLHKLDAVARQAGIPMLIEADGARMRPLKAPADHEPVVPSFADMVVVSAGLSGLDQRLGADFVHRPEIYARVAGKPLGERLTFRDITTVLCSAEGGLKGIPQGAGRVALLNQADTDILQATASRMAGRLLESYATVVTAALGSESGQVFSRHEKIAAVVLAAGGSRRLGVPKQFLDWQGRPLIVHAAVQALAAGCFPVVVVTGAEHELAVNALAGLPVQVVHNPDWEAGQSTSVKAGLAAIQAAVGGAVFLLVDQPFVNAPLIRAVVDSHARSGAPITAPLIDEKRGNPVLFDRVTFPDFAGLHGDVGGRPLFARYRVNWVPWHDSRPLLDIDTLSDYEAVSSLVDG